MSVWVIEDGAGKPIAAYIGAPEGMPHLREGETMRRYLPAPHVSDVEAAIREMREQRSGVVELAEVAAHVLRGSKLTALGLIRLPQLVELCASAGVEINLDQWC